MQHYTDTIELFARDGQLYAVTQIGHRRRRHALVTPPDSPVAASDTLDRSKGSGSPLKTQPAGCQED